MTLMCGYPTAVMSQPDTLCGARKKGLSILHWAYHFDPRAWPGGAGHSLFWDRIFSTVLRKGCRHPTFSGPKELTSTYTAQIQPALPTGRFARLICMVGGRQLSSSLRR